MPDQARAPGERLLLRGGEGGGGAQPREGSGVRGEKSDEGARGLPSCGAQSAPRDPFGPRAEAPRAEVMFLHPNSATYRSEEKEMSTPKNCTTREISVSPLGFIILRHMWRPSQNERTSQPRRHPEPPRDRFSVPWGR
ncbi:hypothetical protein NDU88_007219 [Pleurodeles waltl]|uniref:Uncharacterized protein n=1 Tax=Pleurodeles waltl TaxID=8319 RepID=A0AAV7NSH2_PLEWA|nr:hypothetical protein NDU88_007219 [Pleurodeles waltl]